MAEIVDLQPRLAEAAERKRQAEAREREADRAQFIRLGINPDLADWLFEVREDGSVERVR